MPGREVDEPDAPIETSLNQILAYIRSHWEKVTERNRTETDSYLECKVRSHMESYTPDSSWISHEGAVESSLVQPPSLTG